MKFTLFVTFFLCINFCSIAQANKNYTSIFIDNTKDVDSILKATYSDSLPGVSIAIIKDEKMIFQKNYGVINVTTKKKITASSNFNICSLTKQFTALAILQLEEKHLLSLDDKINRFFP